MPATDVFAVARSNALLILLQTMDWTGKDDAIKHVMSGINP
jgi:polyphosphate kinase 2 (PPK2 family)